MKIPTIDAYANPLATREIAPANSSNIATGNKPVEPGNGSPRGYETLNSPEDLLSKKERDFFVKIFPDNSSKIQNHVLFNNKGRLQTVNVMKGSIVDGRV